MADAILSAFLQVLHDKLVSPIIREIHLLLGVEAELDKLSETLKKITAVLQDAEGKLFTNKVMRHWLTDLKDVAYEINDIVDEVLTEARRRQLKCLQPVREFLAPVSVNRAWFRHSIATRIKEIREKLDHIAKERDQFCLRESERGPVTEDFSTTSAIDKSIIFGRESDVKTIVRLLASDEPCRTSIDIIPILGMAGVGKTTLAQLVFNHEAVSNLFQMKIWIHVPCDCSIRKLMKMIIESILHAKCSLLELDPMQHHLQRLLDGNKYLLILDDWDIEDPHEWERLQIALRVGAKGSKVLLTTQNEDVARALGTTPPHILHVLSTKDCWSLFMKHAFDNSHQTADPNLNRLGKEIVNKCRGLPLAVINAGRLLHSETCQRKWESILNNDTWENVGILRTLRQRYQHLSPPAKRCFAFCSVFPDNFVFDKEALVQLWIAQDFIQSDDDELEERGSQYFDYLCHRSFFQYSHFDYTTNRPRYIMHAHYHNLAKSVAGEECVMIVHGSRCNINKARHASLSSNVSGSKKISQPSPSDPIRNSFRALYHAKGLYTLLLISQSLPNVFQVPDDLADKLRRLRSLELSDTDLYELPDSISKLQHLRYLGLCNTNIQNLPESVCYLYNLQTLRLRNCYKLRKLPKYMKYLIHLRHLDLLLDNEDKLIANGNELRSMPPEIGTLTSLRTLTRFVVSENIRCGIDELNNLAHLHGELHISKLNNVLNASQTMEANLINKKAIEVLELSWEDEIVGVACDQRAEIHVLSNLQPSTALKELRIAGYGGHSYPTWLGDKSYDNLVIIKLFNCKQCDQLPALGQLPSLKELYIKGMHSVARIECAFCGHGEVRGFPSLTKLHFENMLNWEKWRGHDKCNLPSLIELVVKDCPKLLQLAHHLPVLTKLEIEQCPELLGLPSFHSLRSLVVNHSGEWVWRSWRCLSSLNSLILTGLPTTTVPQGLTGHMQIRRVEIRECKQLVSLPDEWFPESLTHLIIKHCPKLRTIPRNLVVLSNLKFLKIHDCEKLALKPEDLKQLKSLQQFEVSACPLLSAE